MMHKLLVLSLFVAAVVGDGMTQAMRDRILSDHNEKRRTATNAANMIELRYDMTLERVAQNYLARGCAGGFQHNPNRGCDYTNLGGTNGGGGSGTCASVGENWYSGYTDNTTGVDVVIGGAVAQWTDGRCSSWASPPLRCGSYWCSEKQNFYQTGSDSYGACTQTSGEILHYTQVMWATTAYVGCYYTTACGTLCDYAYAGNNNLPSMGSIREQNIWKIGTPCSSCPSGYTRCNNGLCSATTSTATTPAPTTTPTPRCSADTTSKPTNGGIGTCGTSTAVGSYCTQTCNTGYTLTSGSLSRQCKTGGVWAATNAVCSAVTCAADSTTKPTNGNAGTCSTANTYGQTCQMACNSGYTASYGTFVRTCGSNGQWSSASATCAAITPAPTSAPITCYADSTNKPTNGNIGNCGTSATVGSYCTQTCNTGYTLTSGSLSRQCTSSRVWAATTAVCSAVTCAADTVTQPYNGNVGTCGSAKTYGQTCQMACNSGYSLTSGSLVRTCGSNGIFSSASATCTATATSAPATTTTPAPTQAPATQAPATQAPATQAPATQAPATPTRYCIQGVGPLSTDDTEFGDVSLIGNQNQISDSNGCPGSIGPTDLTFLSTTLSLAGTYTLHFERTTCGEWYQAIIGAWIDYNQDGTWTDDERLFPFSQQIGTLSYSFTVPTTASLGPTRMRLQVQEVGSTTTTTINPCAAFNWGDTKDYTIVITSGGSQVQCSGDPNVKPVNGVAGTCLTTQNYGQVCTQRCNSGYILTTGSLTSTCAANGQYTPSSAVCSATAAVTTSQVAATDVCLPDNIAPVNGGLGTCAEIEVVGSTCTQTCNPGFTLRVGTSLDRLCTADGYTNSTAICE